MISTSSLYRANSFALLRSWKWQLIKSSVFSYIIGFIIWLRQFCRQLKSMPHNFLSGNCPIENCNVGTTLLTNYATCFLNISALYAPAVVFVHDHVCVPSFGKKKLLWNSISVGVEACLVISLNFYFFFFSRERRPQPLAILLCFFLKIFYKNNFLPIHKQYCVENRMAITRISVTSILKLFAVNLYRIIVFVDL